VTGQTDRGVPPTPTPQVDACVRCLGACLAMLSFYELWVMNTNTELGERLSALAYAHDPPCSEVGFLFP
jgi:hypothetical protein